jgi:fructose-1,6-bisphosphatase/inositol monophosphatase family enzyme
MFSSTSGLTLELRSAIEIARAAGDLILRLRPNLTRSTKSDGSIVTNADLAAADLIRSRFSAAFPDDAVLTEEDFDDSGRPAAPRCWLIDPIDGTKAYAGQSDDFDVYIALIEGGIPIAAVTHQPVTGRSLAAAVGEGAWQSNGNTWERIENFSARVPPRIVTRHWLGAPANWESIQRVAERVGGTAVQASTGISARSVVQPGFDAIVGLSVDGRPIGAKEWDVAPLDLIVRELGGWASDLRGERLTFNKPVPNFPAGLVLAQSRDLGERIVAALAER